MVMMKGFCLLFLVMFADRGAEGGSLTSTGWKCDDNDWSFDFICDGHAQCEDDSDEGKEPGEGCNLFPDSNCLSPGGKRLYQCERTKECFVEEKQATECETSEEPPSRDCNFSDGVRSEPGWKCKDGRCISNGQVCDGVEHCDDASDEGLEPYDGCNKFPNYTNDCASLGGVRHVLCPADDLTCIPADMQYSINMSDVSTCHECPSNLFWRCNDGRCINATLHRNGIPDCLDNSDELPFNVFWYVVLLITIFIVLFGIIGTLMLRRLYTKNSFSCFHCNICSSSRRTKIMRYHSVTQSVTSRGDEVDCGAGAEDDMKQEENEYYPNSDLPLKLIEFLDDKSNWDMEKKDQTTPYARKSQPSLKPDKVPIAKKEYLKVHQLPIEYHHLYSYLYHRNATSKTLTNVTKHLYDWEREFHGENKLEVFKCWRLHLGASDLTKAIITSVSDEKPLFDQVESKLYPARQFARRCRRKLLKMNPLEDESFYKFASLLWQAFVPFFEGCFFYIERLKNLVYIHIFYTALCDLSKNKPSNYPFENSLVITMCLTVAVTQAIFILISFYYAEDIFEVGHKKDCHKSLLKRAIFKVTGIMLSPFIPVFVLANHVYYDAKMSRKRRLLQTYKDTDSGGCDPTDTNEETNVEDTVDAKKEIQEERIKLYKVICLLENKSLLYRKLYSYYRVTSAVLESCTIIICLFLLLFVTSRSNRPINLIVGVEHRLYTFFDINMHGGLIEELNLMRDIVILGSVIYGLAIILTALVKYWYQSKDLSISMSGQVVLGCYMFFMITNKLTTAISLFATTQPLDGNEEPKVTLLSAFIIFIIFLAFRITLVYIYKRYFSAGKKSKLFCRKDQNQTDDEKKRLKRGWETGDMVAQWINVLVNCVVVTPFMVQRETLKVLKDIQNQFDTPEQSQSKRDSLRRRKSFMMRVDVDGDSPDKINVLDNVGGVIIPNMNFFSAPMVYDDLRSAIAFMWWEDPTTKLDVDTIKQKLSSVKNLNLVMKTMKDDDVDKNIRIVLEQMESIGMVNTPLLNPVQTKREYFWLFMIVLAENIIALCIELINGGVWTSQGHYYSWDIRLFCLFAALLLLLTYYTRFHLTKDLRTYPGCGGWLNYLPICFCCRPDTGMVAMPNEAAMERVMSNDNIDGKKPEMKPMSTQTSLSAFPLNSDTFICSNCKGEGQQEDPSAWDSVPKLSSNNKSGAPLATPDTLNNSGSPSPASGQNIELQPMRQPLLDQMKTLVDVRKTKVTEDFDEETEETALLIEELSQAKSSII